jgi:hypothetical protein
MDELQEQDAGGRGRSGFSIKKGRKKEPSRRLVREVEYRFKELGWRDIFIDEFFKDFTDKNFNLEDTSLWVDEYVKYFYSEAKKTTYTSYKQLLYRTGLKRSVVNKLWDIFEPLYGNEYSDDQLYELILEYLYGHVDPVTNKTTPYYIDLKNENQWVSHEENKKKYIMNYNPHTMKPDKVVALLKKTAINETDLDSFFVFHCTCWRYALDIMDSGPLFYKGNNCRDFGIQPSFYVTKSFNMALDWGNLHKKVWNTEIAICVFRIYPHLLNGYKVKSFENVDDEWKDLVKSSRKCKERMNELDKYDFVYGPVCCNPYDIRKYDVQPKAFPNMYQLASKNNKADAFMKEHYIGTIWMRKF